MSFAFRIKVSTFLSVAIILVCFIFGLVGCSHAPWKSDTASSTSGELSSSSTGSTGKHTATGPLPKYYDFEDIPVPFELNIDKNESFIYQTTSFKAGVLVLSGRVDPSSVVSFFSTTLPRENWKLLGGFRYHRSILVFEKGSRICLINVKESPLKTYVEIYVAPRVDGLRGSSEYKLNN